MYHLIRMVFGVALVACCTGALSLGAVGHMTVGTIADRLIAGTNAAKQVRGILRSNLRTASVWADCAKGVSKKTLRYGGDGDYPECAIYENDASKAQMESFVRRNLANCKSHAGAEECHKQYHYTDIATQRDAYELGRAGTQEHDIVGAINASITVLEGRPAPSPFNISGKREALRMLAHYVGDIHQPLHVAAVYLNADGGVVDPDQGTFNPQWETRGGNDLVHGKRKLHAEWDDVSKAFNEDLLAQDALTSAREQPETSGPMSSWAQAWATESLLLGKQAFEGLTYSQEEQGKHQITVPQGYAAFKTKTQRGQVIKAGARLAHILTRIWP